MKTLPDDQKYRFTIMLLLILVFLLPGSAFASSGDTTREIPGLFPEIDGWGAPKKIETYTTENLFDYIDGAAELYLIYGFRELLVAEYNDETGAYIIVEVYYHQTPKLAFGIYSQERPEKEYYIDIGTQGYMISDILNFLSGDAYVKINSSSLKVNNREVLLAFAHKIAAILDTNGSLPAVLDYFPETNRKEYSEKYIPKDFMGYEFFRSAYTADYEDDGAEFTLFIIQGEDDPACEKMLQQYMQFVKYNPGESGQDLHVLPDPYHGDVAMMRKGAYIWGVVGLNNNEKRRDYLLRIENKIPSVNTK